MTDSGTKSHAGEAERGRRSSDDLFKTVFEHAPVMIDSFDAAGNCQLWNRECTKHLGWTLEEVKNSDDPLGLFYPDAKTRESVAATIAKADGKFREYQPMAKDGSVRTQLWADFVLPDGMRISVGHDITDQRMAEQALQVSEERYRGLASRLQNVREEESAKIAREIHDELGQNLTGLKLDISWIRRRVSEMDATDLCGEVMARLQSMSQEIDQTIGSVRRISTQLRPVILDDMGLLRALEWQAKEFQVRTGIRCDFDGPSDCMLDASRSAAVFRIFQEILRNVARHAEANKVSVALSVADGELVLDVWDDGKGISEVDARSARSLGILGMQERAEFCGGRLSIVGANDKGTRVTVTVPLE